MADDGIKEFWRHDAKLFWLQPEDRAIVWIALLGTAIACTLLLIFGDQVGVNQIYARLFMAISGVFVFPLGLAIEMYRKGGNAGSRLKSELDAKNVWKRATKEDVIPIFHELATRSFVLSLSEIRAWIDEVHVRVRECLKETYADEMLMTLQEMFNGDYGHQNNPTERSRAAQRTCSSWIIQWEERLGDHHVNRDFRVPA